MSNVFAHRLNNLEFKSRGDLGMGAAQDHEENDLCANSLHSARNFFKTI